VKVCTTCGTEYPDEQKFCPADGSALRSVGPQGDLIGSIIAERYHVTKKLGEGGMGAVYLGEHVKMGRKSAIKVMSQGMAHDADAIARFNREAANAARINHPNVCAIYDFGETPDGVIYLAMEFIEGEALTDLIKREGALTPQRSASILKQAAEALQAAHDLGIVHRDLKPDNIMIAAGRGGSDIVKVVDFGIAKAMGGEEGQNVTKTGLVVGTPEYMSPEQLSGDVLDGRSDIYSLALVFYRMLTGALPFKADSAQETMIKRLTDDPLPLNQAKPGASYPPALQRVMDKALSRMPGGRYDNAAEFGIQAAAAVEGMAAPSAAAPDTDAATQLLDSAQVTAQLSETQVSGAPATAPDAATAAMPATSVDQPTPTTPRPAPSPVHPPKKKAPIAAIAAAVVVVAGVGIGAIVLTGGDEGGLPLGGGDGTQGDSGRVTDDTARTPTGGQPSRSDPAPVRNGGTQTAADPSRPGVPITPRESTVVAPPVPAIRVAAADAFFWLDQALDGLGSTNYAGIRDTAMAIYREPAVSIDDRGFAAFVIAQSYGVIGNRPDAISWGDSAVRLVPTSQAYQQYVTRLRGGGG